MEHIIKGFSGKEYKGYRYVLFNGEHPRDSRHGIIIFYNAWISDGSIKFIPVDIKFTDNILKYKFLSFKEPNMIVVLNGEYDQSVMNDIFNNAKFTDYF